MKLPLILTLISFYGCLATANELTNDLLITNIRVISPENLNHEVVADVFIQDGIIVSINKPVARKVAESVKVIDGKGRFLIPGLIDGHTHLNEVPGMTFEHERKYPNVSEEARRQIPKSYLFHGFTTVIDLNSEPISIGKWNSKLVRPNAYFCGASPVFDGYPMSFMPKPERYRIMPYFLYDKSRADEFPLNYNAEQHSPSAVVERIHEDGGICVKTHYERGLGGRGNLPLLTTELASSLIAEAHLKKMPVLLHANSESAQEFGIKIGVDSFAHGMWSWNNRTTTELNAEITDALDAAIRKGIALQPTIQVLYGEQDIHNPEYLSQPNLRHVLPDSLLKWYATEDGQWWRKRMLSIPIVSQIVGEGRWAELDEPPIARVTAALSYFSNNGGTLLFGSDTPSDPTFANPPGLNGRLEINNWIAAGVTPTQLFSALTLNNAEFFGLADRVGTIKPGKSADLLILSVSPLETVKAYDSIEYVIINGQALDRFSLSAIPKERQ